MSIELGSAKVHSSGKKARFLVIRLLNVFLIFRTSCFFPLPGFRIIINDGNTVQQLDPAWMSYATGSFETPWEGIL